MKEFISRVFVVGLTIFAMLFGAGNLMFPLRLGMECGNQTIWGLSGFIVTGVILPLLGLIAIVLFQGNYKEFFGRIGTIPGNIAIAFSMMIIGPFVVMPRIIGLSYEMLQPFLPTMSVGLFAVIFLTLAFIATYRPTKLLTIIGRILSPLKVISILTIVIIGVVTAGLVPTNTTEPMALFLQGIETGYYTLDLLGAIFFGSIIVSLLTTYAPKGDSLSMRSAVKIAAWASVGAAALLSAVYAGMSLIGACHGAGLEGLNEGAIFSAISFKVLGAYGAALIGFTVFLACFTTTVSLTAVVAQYIRSQLFNEQISYSIACAITLITTAVFARHGLSAILSFSIPLIVACYPIFIVITLCNLAYKLWGFPYIKVPVLVTTLAVAAPYIMKMIGY